MASHFDDILNLRVPSSFLSQVKPPTSLEKLATVWMKLHKSGKSIGSDPVKNERIKALIKSCESLSSIACAAGLNNWRVLIASLSQPILKGKNVRLIEKWNRKVCNLFLCLEKIGYEEPKNIKNLLNGLKESKSSRGFNLIANIINNGFLPILLFPKSESVIEDARIESVIEDARIEGLKPVTDEMGERVRILKGTYALFNECWNSVKFPNTVRELKDKVENTIEGWLKFEALYEGIQTGNPRFYFELQELINQFSIDAFIGLFARLLEEGNLKNSDLPYLGTLMLQITEGVFNATKRAIELSCEFIETMIPRINCHSLYFTPLDLFRMWWIDPYIRHEYISTSEVRDSISILCQVLLTAHIREGDNVYGAGLDKVATSLSDITTAMEEKYNLEPFLLMKRMIETGPFPKILLYWLNTPLSYVDFEKNDDHLFEQIEEQWRRLAEGVQSRGVGSVITSINTGDLRIPLDYHTILVPSQSKEMKAIAIRNKFNVEVSFMDLTKILSYYNGQTEAGLVVTEYEDVRRLYLGPFYKYGEDLLRNNTNTLMNRTRLQSQVENNQFNPEEFLQVVLQRQRSTPLKHQVRTLAELLMDARFPRAIHRSIARTFEAIVPSKKLHTLGHLAENDEEKKVLSEVEKHLNNKFYLERVDEKKIIPYFDLLCQKLKIKPIDLRISIREMPIKTIPNAVRLKNTFNSAYERLIKSLPEKLPLEEEMSYQKRIVKRNQIIQNFPDLLSEVEKISSYMDSEVLPLGLRSELILNTGLVLEGAMKIILSLKAINHANIPSVHKFEQRGVNHRLLVNNHQLFDIFQSIESLIPTAPEEYIALIQKWNNYSLVSRYPYQAKNMEPLLPYLQRESTLDLQNELMRDVDSILFITSKLYDSDLMV